jgi:hypothetical protein
MGTGGIAKIQYRLSGPSTPTWTTASFNSTTGQFVISAPSNHSSDGVNVYRVRAVDKGGNISDSDVFTIKIDTTAPVVTDNAPMGWSKSAVTVTLAATDIGGSDSAAVEYNLDGTGWTSGTSVNVAAPSNHSNDGVHTVDYRATDAAGNTGTGSGTVRIDTTNPTVTDNADTAWHGSDVTVTLSALDAGSGIGKVQYRKATDSTWTDGSSFIVAAASDHSNDGVNVYRYRAIDSLGNVSDTGSCSVKIDTTKPVVTDNAPTAWKKTAVTVTLNATDLGGSGVASVQYRKVGDTDWTTGSSIVVDAAVDHSNDGTNSYEYRALDNVGNVSSTGTCAVKIDTTKPTATDDAPAGWSDSDVTVTITGNDGIGSGIGKIQYRLSSPSDPTWHDATAGQFTVLAPPDHTNDGVHVYRYRVFDNVGNISDTGICTVRISTL